MKKISMKTLYMKILKYAFCGLLFCALTFIFALGVEAMPLNRRVIVVDAGHGGRDPGMVSGKTDEKDVNLAIARKLQAHLELGGATVIITRADDNHLSKTKAYDMALRQIIANSAQADIFVSIHQNSFSNSSVHGAQVFYFDESGESERLARAIQEQIKAAADPGNRFDARANDKYFVLKKTEMPAVLVECGFLTNPGEKARLLTDSYQEKIAWAIYMGIVDYFNVVDEPGGE
jgi:N-acetylmuramoyl-L-alanine amidase